jgi:hypothetical protein
MLNKQGSDGQGGKTKNALDDPGIQVVAKQTFTPQFIQSSAEQIIDGTTPWLDGKTAKPTFLVDLTKVKSDFADNIGAYATKRFASLPDCATGQQTDSTDILTVGCRPAGYNPAADIAQAVSDMKTSKDFIANTTISADTFTVGGNGDKSTVKEPLFSRLSNVPKGYRLVRIAPILLGVLCLLSVSIIIFGSTERRRGIKRVAYTLYTTSGLLLLEAWTAMLLARKAQASLSAHSSTNSLGLQDTIVAVIKQVQHSLNGIVLAFAAGFLILAIGMSIYLVATKPKPDAKPNPVRGESDILDDPTPVEEATAVPKKPVKKDDNGSPDS